MTTVFTACYLADRNRERPLTDNPVAQAFFRASAPTAPCAFPFDGSDDPAFFSAKHLNGPVSWGVCRTDVRNRVKRGDWVVFFARESTGEADDWQYRFVAVLKVEQKTSGWNPPGQFDRYLNRLVVHDRDACVWRHAEPSTLEREWHADWMWRLSAGPRGRKHALVKKGKEGRATADHFEGERVDGLNYVVFARDSGFVLDDPPVVAHCNGTGKRETWLTTPTVVALRDAVFGDEREGHYLRSSNQNQPHRHTRRKVRDGDSWFAAVQAAAGAL